MQSDTRPQVLVLGARGRLGAAAVQAFSRAGWRVLAQARRGAPEAALPDVDWLRTPVQDTGALAEAAAGADVVVHALNPAFSAWHTEALPLLEAAMRVSRRLGARLMMPGNVYNFGESMPAMLDETTPQIAGSRKGRIRIEMERRLSLAARDGALRSVVLRAGDFFGSGRGSWFDRALAKNLERGRMTYPGPGDVPVAWAYVPDLAQCFVRLAEHERAGGRMEPFELLHFRGHSLSATDWLHVLTPIAHREGWLWEDEDLRLATLPWGLIRWASPLVPMWRELAEMAYLWNTPHALSGTRLAGLIGPEPCTPLAQAATGALQALGKLRSGRCARLAWA